MPSAMPRAARAAAKARPRRWPPPVTSATRPASFMSGGGDGNRLEMAGDARGGIAGEEEHAVGDVAHLDELRVFARRLEVLGSAHHGRGDGVDPDTARRQLNRK